MSPPFRLHVSGQSEPATVSLGIRRDKSSASQTTRGGLLGNHAIGFIATFADDECVILSDRDNSSVLPMAMQRAAR
jgi:hypothetical protein